MIIILKKIKSNTTVIDIEDFLQSALEGGFFKRKGWIESINIQELHDVKKDTFDYNALVVIKPDLVGKRVIKLLDRKALNAKRINVSEFHVRSYHNDRRISRYKKLNTRRIGDRRRNVEIKDITDYRKTPAIDIKALLGWNTDSII